MKLTPTDILNRHARERFLRRAVRSANLDGDLASGAPRMSLGAWVESCALVAGVDERILDVLGARECLAAGTSWVVEGVEVQGQTWPIQLEQVAEPPTLAQAARMLGLRVPRADLKAMRLEAIQRIAENLLRRGGRGEILPPAREERAS